MEGGSKSIERVGKIIQCLENGPADGLTTAQIAEGTGIDRATVHRAVGSLERIGFVDRDPRSKIVRLGTYLFSLGAKTARRYNALAHARDVVTKLAEETGDTVFLTVRNKYDGVCIDRCSGSYPLKAQTLSVGESLPLGVSSAGLAIMATMSDDDVRHVIQYNSVNINGFHRIKPQELYKHVEDTRKRGYAIYFGHIVAGMGALGFAINDARGQALAAISLSAVLDRLKDDRVKMIADKLRTAIQEIEQRVALISQGEFGHR
jgi:DNA-binding IclR family transcriptional regulator